MTEHRFEGPDGRIWRARERPAVRRDDGDTQVTVELETTDERRVVICLRGEWERDAPDLRELLARSIPAGASRGLGAPPDPEPQPDGDPGEGLSW